MFIAFEGLAGTGKSTQAKYFSEYLQQDKGKEVYLSAAYEGDKRKLVSDFMNKSGIKSDSNAVMFLFQALHAAQFHEVTEALHLGKTVISDRWRESFFAFHLYADTFKGDRKLMESFDILAYRNLEPDVCFLIDVPADVAYTRYIKREAAIADNGLKIAELKYFINVREYYLKIGEQKKWCVIDGNRPPTEVFEDIKDTIEKQL